MDLYDENWRYNIFLEIYKSYFLDSIGYDMESNSTSTTVTPTGEEGEGEDEDESEGETTSRDIKQKKDCFVNDICK